jgi:nucleoside-diphosphate-sugar epimerase
MNDKNKKVIVTGATGYLGMNIIKILHSLKGVDVYGISQSKFIKNLQISKENLCDSSSIDLFKDFEVIINCAYDNKSKINNLKITDNLLKASNHKNIKLFIHISTAVVSGLTSQNYIDDETLENPTNEYQINKLEIENKLISNIEKRVKLIILRPTMVIGKNSVNLDFIINKYKNKNPIHFMYFSILRKRKTNLVSVNNVIDVIVDIIRNPEKFGDTKYILSQDDDPNNNYENLDKIIRNLYKIKPRKVKLFIPNVVLKIIFLLLKSHTSPFIKFYSSNLKKINYSFNEDIKTAIIENFNHIENK